MSARRESLAARLARLGVDGPRVLDDLRAAGLLAAGADGSTEADAAVLDAAALVRISESADPAAAASVLAGLAAADPGLAARVGSDPDWFGRVVAVAGASRPLGELLARGTDAVLGLASLDPVDPTSVAAAVEAAVRSAADTPAQAAGIASIRRRATADIAARDLTGAADVAQVATELAALAEGVLAGTMAAVHAELGGPDPRARVAVIGMGKLGGRELNYVSDVDVMFVHAPVEGADPAAADEEARRVCARLLELLNASTTMGRAYEVDPTLRPEGRAGALSRTIEGFTAYWERWARTWEFQALLKARPVAGDRELGAALLAAAEPFLWPERLDPDVVAEVRAMKARIETKPEVVRDGARQLKLGPGGIRDVEFTVQLLQLVHGRADPALRLGGTLPALAALAAGGYVEEEDAAVLSETYRTLRRVEHALQLANERRTHTVPPDAAAQDRIARALGYRSGPDGTPREQLLTDLTRAQGRVRDLHARIFYRPLLERIAEVPASTAAVTLPGAVAAMGEVAAAERLTALGFRDGAAALRSVRAITGGVSRRAVTMRSVLPAVLRALEPTADPDGGLLALRDLVESQREGSQLLRHLRDQPASADLLGRALGTCRAAGELLVAQPQGAEWLADPSALASPRDPSEVARNAVARLHWQDTDAALRRFKQQELLRVVLRDVGRDAAARPGTPERGPGPGAELAAIADACLVAALRGALRARATAEGLGSPDELPVDVAVIGMGTLAGRELSYASDLDVVFVHRPVAGADPDEASRIAIAVAADVLRSLSAITPDGSAFEIDADLRPEGRSGPLSRSLDGFLAYWERWAEPWEFQALLRTRSVAGDRELGVAFEAEAARRAHPERLEEARVVELRRMKARIERERVPARLDPVRHVKLGPGGISDVEWTVQLLQLRHGHRLPALRTASTTAALDALEAAGLLPAADAGHLRDGLRFAVAIRDRQALMRHRDVDVLPEGGDRLERLARALGYGRGGRQELEADWFRHARRVRRVAERELYGMERPG